MIVGFEYRTIAGDTVLIDDQYKNLKLARVATSVRGSGTLNQAWKLDACLANIQSAAGAPVVAVKSDGDWVAGNFKPEGDAGYFFAWRGEPYTGGKIYAKEYAVFDSAGTLAESHNLGLQVFNASGEVTFDARYKYLTVVDIVTLTSFPEISAGQAIKKATHNACPGAYYVVGPFSGYVEAAEDVGVSEYSLPMVRQISDTEFQYALMPFGGSNGGNWRFLPSSYQVVVCRPSF